MTVFEQSDVRVGAPAGDSSASLTPQQADALVALGARMGVRIASWQGKASLRVQQFVGVACIGDLQLEILPKLEGCAGTNAIRQNLLAMLSVTEDLELQASDRMMFVERDEPFIAALARLYCHRLLEAVRRGLPQEYVVHHEVIARVRGKIDWPTQARLHVAQRPEFGCIFDERSENTLLNRTLKAALLQAARLLEGVRSDRMATELRHMMADVGDQRPSPADVLRSRTDRMSRHLQPLLTLAKLILGNRNPDLGRSADGDRDTFALVWDMNVLFEEYVGRVCRQALRPKGFEVGLHESDAYLARDVELGRYAFLLRPDVIVLRDRKPCVVMDTKWKRLCAERANLGVSSGDVYQVLAYCQRFRTSMAVLVYPHTPTIGVPGVQREFETQGAGPARHRVRVVTVDLAHLEDVPSQLQRGLFTESLGGACLGLS
ncbi:MAG: McrC family protein [bacterium]